METPMYLAAVAVIILILKLAGVDPVAKWSWFYVLIPFVVLAFWWEYLSKWIGWDKRAAEKKMAEAVKENAATKKKNRGF
jgi:small Trp-rich protein